MLSKRNTRCTGSVPLRRIMAALRQTSPASAGFAETWRIDAAKRTLPCLSVIDHGRFFSLLSSFRTMQPCDGPHTGRHKLRGGAQAPCRPIRAGGTSS